jgi:hypothetical protein
MPTIARFLATHRSLKQRAVVPAYRALARGNVLFPGPRVFANGFPKAGTHLLATLLRALPWMMFSGVHRAAGDYTVDGGTLDWDAIRRTLGSVNRGQFMTGHFPALDGLPDLLERLGYAILLVIRDPRDIVVSTERYAAALRSHDLYRRFTEQLTTPAERMTAVIEGFEADAYGRGLPSIGARLDMYLGWLADPRALVVRFEDLIGPAGGGDSARQAAAVAAVARHVGRELSPERAGDLARRVWSTRSSTFHSGQVGSWQRLFTDEHRQAFKAVAGRQLVELGYETGSDW